MKLVNLGFKPSQRQAWRANKAAMLARVAEAHEDWEELRRFRSEQPTQPEPRHSAWSRFLQRLGLGGRTLIIMGDR